MLTIHNIVFIFLNLSINHVISSVIAPFAVEEFAESTYKTLAWKNEINSKIYALEKFTATLGHKLEEIDRTLSSIQTNEDPGYIPGSSNIFIEVDPNETIDIMFKDSEGNNASSSCFINIDKVSKLQPLLVSLSLTWPTFEIDKAGAMMIPKGKEFLLICPSKFANFPENYVTATCVGGTQVTINGVEHNFSDLQCTEEVKHVVKRTGENCLPGHNTEWIRIFYKLFNDEIIKLYDICMVIRHHDVMFVKHTLQYPMADVDFETSWSDSNEFGINFDEAYDCDYQTSYISRKLGRNFHKDDKCCFSKKQLVNYRDVFPGVPQRGAYSYMNIAPHWSTCNADNWDDVERRVRALAKSSRSSLLVWTGVKYDDVTNIKFGSSACWDCLQPTPIYFWKVVQNPETKSSLAIIQVNVPDLAPNHEYTLCTDVCDQTGWMEGSNWSNLSKGYTYCCNIEEFEKAFGFQNVFEPNFGAVLTSAPRVL